MEHFKNFFKSRIDAQEFFKHQMFKFSFMCDNTIFFDTLEPRIIEGVLYSFEISFYHESGFDFFNYSSFSSYLNNMQLHKVDIIRNADNNRETMFFKQYRDTSKY